MRPTTPHRRHWRAILVIGSLAIAAGCGDVLPPAARAPLAFALAFPTEPPSGNATFGAGIDSVYLSISRPNEQTVVDTLVAFPSTQNVLELELDIDLEQKVETLSAYIELRDSPNTLWYGYSDLILRERTLPLTPVFALTYIGPGYDAVTVGITPRTTFAFAGSSVQYGATAYNGQGLPNGAPIGWSVSDDRMGSVSPTGLFTARTGANGTVRLRAFTPTGVADSLTITVSNVPQLRSGAPR